MSQIQYLQNINYQIMELETITLKNKQLKIKLPEKLNFALKFKKKIQRFSTTYLPNLKNQLNVFNLIIYIFFLPFPLDL